MATANKIAFYREQAGLTQQQAAKSAGWNQGRWSSYETGDRSPRPEVVLKILDVFKQAGLAVTFEDLFSANSTSRAA